MLVLTIRTDKPDAEVGIHADGKQLAYETWTAHRQLAETLHAKILDILQSQNLSLTSLTAVACYAGPGSFTGLRIGLTVANALAYALEVPIVATSGDDWMQIAVKRLSDGENDSPAIPEYGSDAHITLPKK